MKTVCEQEKLHAGLSIVNRATPGRTSVSINKNVLIEAEDNNLLKMRANNGEISITTWVPAEVNSPGDITVPARLLNEFIGLLPKDKVTLEGTEEEAENKSSAKPHMMRINCDRSETHINGTGGEMFPKPPELKEPTTILINAQEFKTAIDMVAFAAATDSSRPILTGVQIILEGQEFTLTATDGFRLSQKKGQLEGEVDETISVMVPTTSLSEFNHIRGDSSQPVRMTVSKDLKEVRFETKTAQPNEYPVELTSHLLEGNLPEYGQLIPKEYTTRAVFDTKSLIMGVRSAQVFAKDGNNTIRLQMNVNPGAPNESGGEREESPGTVTITAKSEEIGNNSAVIDAVEMSGDDLLIGFNNKYLMDALSSIDASGVTRVTMQLQTPGSPGVLKTSESDEYTHIIMPMFLKD